MKQFKIEDLLAVYDLEGITLQELVKTINECRTSALIYAKDGADLGPDYALRLKAVEVLSKLVQIPAFGKLQAVKKEKGGQATDLEALLREPQSSQLDSPKFTQ